VHIQVKKTLCLLCFDPLLVRLEKGICREDRCSKLLSRKSIQVEQNRSAGCGGRGREGCPEQPSRLLHLVFFSLYSSASPTPNIFISGFVAGRNAEFSGCTHKRQNSPQARSSPTVQRSPGMSPLPCQCPDSAHRGEGARPARDFLFACVMGPRADLVCISES
jgi:hypothetical protein